MKLTLRYWKLALDIELRLFARRYPWRLDLAILGKHLGVEK